MLLIFLSSVGVESVCTLPVDIDAFSAVLDQEWKPYIITPTQGAVQCQKTD